MTLFRKLFFLICLGGGVLFGVLFFATFGAREGYSLRLAGICTGGGAFFAIAFYFIWIIMEKFQKPPTFENARARQRILAYEAECALPSDKKAEGFMRFGKGLKQEICETCLYLCLDQICIVFCHFGKIHTARIPYPTIETVRIRGNALLLERQDDKWGIAIKSVSAMPFLRSELRGLGLAVIEGNMQVCEILRHDEEAMEADVMVSDGAYQLLCYAHPFSPSEKFTLSAFMTDHIMAAEDADYRIEKTQDGYYSHCLQGVLMDRGNRLVHIGEIAIELDGEIPDDIEEWDFIQFTALRIDLIPQ